MGEPAQLATHLGGYRLLARLGAGGMAEVLLGRRDGPGGFVKHVAIKRMRPELTNSREFVDLFLEEARTAAMLSHPNICQVHALVAEDGDYFMVLEYLDGVPVSTILARLLAQPGCFTLPFLGGILVQACEGIQHAHDATDDAGRPLDLIHRDISPPNLYLTDDGVVKILDFGISKSRTSVVKTLTGQIRGKFAYMSPEQLRGEKLDRRSDVFSLGIVLYELATGRRLFRRANRLEVFKAIVRERIPSAAEANPALPPLVVEVIDRALTRDRDERFASARAFGHALGGALRDLGGPLTAVQLGPIVAHEFAAELGARRQLLVDPPGLSAEAPPPSSGTDATSKQRPAKQHGTLPAAAAAIDTAAKTWIGSGVPPESTAVDLAASSQRLAAHDEDE